MNEASGGDEIPVELFQILKDDAVKVLHSICQQVWKTQQWPQDWKRSVFIPVPKKGNAKECSNSCKFHNSTVVNSFRVQKVVTLVKPGDIYKDVLCSITSNKKKKIEELVNVV